MKSEQEIVLQKKTIVIFSMIILTVIVGVLNIQKAQLNEVALNNEDEKQVYTAYNADEQFLTIEISGEEIIDEKNVLSIESPVDQLDNQSNEIQSISNTEKLNTKSGEEPINNDESQKETNDNQEKQVMVASRGSYVRETNVPPTEYESVITVKATAYCLCMKCCGKAPDSPGYGNTASGLKIIPNTGMKVIAVDPSVVPLGTEVYIEGLNGASDYGYAIAADTGGAIKSNKIDLYMDTHEQALAWGVKTVNMYILSND